MNMLSPLLGMKKTETAMGLYGDVTYLPWYVARHMSHLGVPGLSLSPQSRSPNRTVAFHSRATSKMNIPKLNEREQALENEYIRKKE